MDLQTHDLHSKTIEHCHMNDRTGLFLTWILAAGLAAGERRLAIEGFGVDVVFFRLVLANGKTTRVRARRLFPAAAAEGVPCPFTAGRHNPLCHSRLLLVNKGSTAFIVSNAVIARRLFVRSVFVLEEAIMCLRLKHP